MPHLKEILTEKAVEKLTANNLTVESLADIKKSLGKIIDFIDINRIIYVKPIGRFFAVPQSLTYDAGCPEIFLRYSIDLGTNGILCASRNQMKKNLSQLEIDNSEGDALFCKLIKEKHKYIKKDISDVNIIDISDVNIIQGSEFYVSTFDINYSEFVVDCNDEVFMECNFHFHNENMKQCWINICDPTLRSISHVKHRYYHTKIVYVHTTEIQSTNRKITISEILKITSCTGSISDYLKNCIVDLDDLFLFDKHREPNDIFLFDKDDEPIEFGTNFDYNGLDRTDYVDDLSQNKPYACLDIDDVDCLMFKIRNDPDQFKRIPFGLLLLYNLSSVDKLKRKIVIHSKFISFLIGTIKSSKYQINSGVRILPNNILSMIYHQMNN
jgi:hypothetical protein